MSNQIILIIAVVITVAIVLAVRERISQNNDKFESEDDKWKKYQYRRKNFFMTRAEHECFDALFKAIGNEYFIFAQVHLPTLVDHKISGQNWKIALSHINRKSVDFVLCDKNYISPKLAIELDDKSHERPDRQERDREVESILKNAGITLLRLENHGQFNPDELVRKIKEKIGAQIVS
jgi:very-short-patch-repair endonuclease